MNTRAKMKKITSIILVILLACTFASCNFNQNKSAFQFKEVEGGYGVHRYKGASTQPVLDIPDTYENKPVTEIMKFGIANSEYIKTLNIGKNITKIDVWAMTNCKILETINVSEDNPSFKSVDGALYSKDMTQLIAYPNGKTPLTKNKEDEVTDGGGFVVPDTVQTIADNAFYLSDNLYSIQFNEGLLTIGNRAFLKCVNLTAINLPNTVTKIGADAFSYCNTIKELEIPSSVEEIADYAFFSTSSSLEKITIHKKSADELKLGKSWTPVAKKSINGKIDIEYVGK